MDAQRAGSASELRGVALRRLGSNTWVNVASLGAGAAGVVYGGWLALTGHLWGAYWILFGLVLAYGGARSLREGGDDDRDESDWSEAGERRALLISLGFIGAGTALAWVAVSAIEREEHLDAAVGGVGAVAALLLGSLGTVGILIARRRRRSTK